MGNQVNTFNKSNIVEILDITVRGALVVVDVPGAKKQLQQIYASVRQGKGAPSSNPNFYIRVMVCTLVGNLDKLFTYTEFSPVLSDTTPPYAGNTMGDVGLVKYDQVWTYPFKSDETFRYPIQFGEQERCVVFCSYPVHVDGADTGTFPATLGYIVHLSANGEVLPKKPVMQ